MSIVDELIANPGTYLGISHHPGDPGEHSPRHAARIVVTPLPGGAGVTVDYETFDPGHPERVRPHVEHAVIGRVGGGASIMVTGHAHADTVAVLREGERGEFGLGEEPAAFPMAVRIEVPAPGRIVYVWSYGEPGGEAVPRDRAEVERTD